MLIKYTTIHSSHFESNNSEILNFVSSFMTSHPDEYTNVREIFYQFMEDNKLMGYWNATHKRFKEDYSTIKCKGEYVVFAFDNETNRLNCFWSDDGRTPLPDNVPIEQLGKHTCTCDVQQLLWGDGCTCKGM